LAYLLRASSSSSRWSTRYYSLILKSPKATATTSRR
jgi:hypothetical protein